MRACMRGSMVGNLKPGIETACVWGRWVALHAWGAMRACMHGSVDGNLKPGIETACVGEVGCNACVGWPEREGRS